MNFVCRNEALKKQVYERLKLHFTSVHAQKIPEDVNEVLYLCSGLPQPTEVLLENMQKLNSITRRGKTSNDISQLLEGLKVL